MKRIGPYSRDNSLSKIDHRTREGRLMKSIRADLVAHVGGKPTATQRVLIDRAAALTLQLAMMDRAAAEKGGTISERDGRQYLAWSNALSRLVRQIGLNPAKSKAPDLAEYLAARAAA